jgi:hypothetical protein
MQQSSDLLLQKIQFQLVVRSRRREGGLERQQRISAGATVIGEAAEVVKIREVLFPKKNFAAVAVWCDCSLPEARWPDRLIGRMAGQPGGRC